MSDRPTIRALGHDWPVLAELPEDWKLVAHPNGPAVCCDESIGVVIATINRHHENIPVKVMEAAVDAYVKLTWNKVRAEFL